MRNLHEVLRQKEMDLARVRHEVEALRFVAPMLFETDDQSRLPPELLQSEALSKNRWPLQLDELSGISPGA